MRQRDTSDDKVDVTLLAYCHPDRSPLKTSPMSQKKPFKIGALVHCECPAGVAKLPFGLPRNARVEVVGTHNGATLVKYYSRTFSVPIACVHRQVKDHENKSTPSGKLR